jgi:CRISPR-associated endonuclease/helicase Cas3
VDRIFSKIFGVPKPYGTYQIKPAEYLLSGRNVILQAPTGSGKTMAALFPYLLARYEKLDFPRKMLYCVPMRVLARSFHSDLTRRQGVGKLDARLQTGEQQDDRLFEAEVTFATIDQVLSSFLNIPYSLSLRQGNVNAGGVVSSYLVFDEFHLLDPGSTLPTTLEMLRWLRGVTPFLLMTATFSGEMLGRLAALLDAEVVTVSPKELDSIPSQKAKERYIYRADELLSAEAVLSRHQRRSVAICNTVERAQALFAALQEELQKRGDEGTRLVLLHSRFLQADRRAKEDEVRGLFGKDAPQAGSAILVATQVIEVGLDITCEVMHTEVAPASAIVQRAGRCARYAGEKGVVYVYQVPQNQKGEPNYAPYTGKQAVLCGRTWEALARSNGKKLDFPAEQHLINEVHTQADARVLEDLSQTSYAYRQKMVDTIRRQEIALARELIRSDDSVAVIVHPNPSEIEHPYDLESFSLFFGTLHGQFEEWRAAGLPDGRVSWLLKYPQQRDAGEVEDRPASWEWIKVGTHQDLRRSPIYAVNPLLVRYDSEIGFRFVCGGNFQSPIKKLPTPPDREHRWKYKVEIYREHVQKMLNVYERTLYHHMAYAASRLETLLKLPVGSLDRAVRLAIALHDVGKMDRRWQKWAHEWQRRIGAPVYEDCMLAHTDYDPRDPRHQAIEGAMPGSRPPHAAEGAVAVLKVIYHLLGGPKQNDSGWKLLKALFTAIVRHHSPKTDSYEGFSLHRAAATTLAGLLASLGVAEEAVSALEMSRSPQSITDLLVQPALRDELLLYFIIVRALRLADQRAMAEEE